MRRCLRAVLLATLLLAVVVPPTAAGEEWCEADPLVLIVTPGGAWVPVFVTSGAQGSAHLPAVLAATIRSTSKPVESGQATLVKLEVLVPGDLVARSFATRSVASTGPLASGTIYTSAWGVSDQVMQLEFKLAVP